jgi:putative transposase
VGGGQFSSLGGRFDRRQDFAAEDARGCRLQEMTLSGEEFLRRFLLHVLPERFVRIRYYGLLANRHREQALALCREALPGPLAPPKLTKSDWQSRLQSLTEQRPEEMRALRTKRPASDRELKAVQSLRAPPR